MITKKEKIILNNGQIFSIAEKLILQFEQEEYIKTLPAIVNFYIKKNYNTFYQLALEIESIRTELLKKLTDSNKESVQKELDELSCAEQEIEITKIPLSSLEGYDLSYKEIDTLFFMIYEDETKE